MGDVTDALLRWYDEEGRDLPWRRTRDPYAVLVSEVMLQQTQVARVIPRYEAWLARWPDAGALAAASPADVLREWVGLGYNRRALRLRDACVVVARDGWPATAAALRALPGVGPYTAAAVASFAFDEQVAAVDVNVARVSGRLGTRPAALVPAGRAASFNHAMMDLGATCPAAGAGPAPAPRVAARQRFEETDRFARGRIVAALAAGEPLPVALGEERTERALAGLARDGMVVRDGDAVRLP